MKTSRFFLVAFIAAWAGTAAAQEATLSAVLFVPRNTTFGEIFVRFVDKANADGKGLVLASEICVATPAIRKNIRSGDSHLLFNELQTGKKHQMQTMDASLLDLYQRGEISYDVAVSAAREPTAFKHRSSDTV